MPRPHLSAEAFRDAWNASSSVREMCERTGYSASGARVRAHRLRMSGLAMRRLDARLRDPSSARWASR